MLGGVSGNAGCLPGRRADGRSMDWPYIVAAALGLAMVACERAVQRKAGPRVERWLSRVIVLDVAGLCTVFLFGGACAEWLSARRWWSAEHFGFFGATAIGYLTLSLLNYWWHWLRRRNA